jgi:hypothetical protein
MKHLIDNIREKLGNEVSALKYIDQDWGQMDYFNPPPVKFPCALLDIQSVNYSNTTNNMQIGEAILAVRLFDMRLSNSSIGAPSNMKEQAGKIWQLVEDINRALHHQFVGASFGKPVRTQMRRTKRNDGCYQTEIYYKVPFVDSSCAPQVAPVQVNLSVEKEICATLS